MKNNDRNGQYSRFEKSTSIIGDIKTKSDIRIDGKLKGLVETSGKIIIGLGAYVEGKVICKEADVEGQFKGEINVTETLALKSSGEISGDVNIGKLMVEAGAKFNATCAMKSAKSNVKSLKLSNAREKTA